MASVSTRRFSDVVDTPRTCAQHGGHNHKGTYPHQSDHPGKDDKSSGIRGDESRDDLHGLSRMMHSSLGTHAKLQR